MYLKFSASLVEQFNCFYLGKYNESITQQAIIDYISKPHFDNNFTSRGTAYHKLIEQGPDEFMTDNGLFEVKSDNNLEIFSMDEVKPIYEFLNKYPGGVFEAPAKLDLKVNGFDVKIGLKIDYIHGLNVHDFKTTSRQPDLSNYETSLQWPLYLMATEVDTFKYQIFEFYSKKDIAPRVNHYEYTFYRFNGMENKVKQTIDLLIRFCEHQNLMEYVIKNN